MDLHHWNDRDYCLISKYYLTNTGWRKKMSRTLACIIHPSSRNELV